MKDTQSVSQECPYHTIGESTRFFRPLNNWALSTITANPAHRHEIVLSMSAESIENLGPVHLNTN